MIKSLKFWHNWFHRQEPVADMPGPGPGIPSERKPLSHIAVRAALRQKQRQAKTPQ